MFVKIRSLWHGLLWFGIWFPSLGWTQEGFGEYQYQPPVPGIGRYSTHQWRPIEDQYFYQAEEVQTFRDGSEVIANPSGPVMGLPPGTYRPMDNMNRTAPQVGTYRFRTLTSDEKSRLDKIGQQHNADNQGRAQARLQFRGYENSSMRWSPGSFNQPYFRPDDRFANDRPTLTDPYHPYQSQHSPVPSYWSPLFRPEDQDR